jgi:outer membrane protein OmpA-like peptidoglycan-associated protein
VLKAERQAAARALTFPLAVRLRRENETMSKKPMRIESVPAMRAAVLILAALAVTACVTEPASRARNGAPAAGSPAPGRASPSAFHVKEAHAVDNPCDLSRQRMSKVGGSILGAIIGFGACRLAGEVLAPGASTADKNRVGAGCAVLGGLAGYTWAADSARRQCELYQVAQRNQLNAVFQEVTVIEPVAVTASATSAPAASNRTQETTVTVMTLPGVGHFATGSATLTPQARQYFAAIAQQYTYQAQADSLRRSLPPEQQSKGVSTNDMNTLRKEWDRIRIVLVGHTDDTGGDATNATLSEQRARAVAEVFRASGISADRLFYQGAGSSLPIGDNRTEEGRARNRRVEVIELPPDADVGRYLALRKPNPDFFRPLPSQPPRVASASTRNASIAAPEPARAPASAGANRTPPSPSPPVAANRAPPSAPAGTSDAPSPSGPATKPAPFSDAWDDSPVAKAPPASQTPPSKRPATAKPAQPATAALPIDFGGVPASPFNKAIADALGHPKPTEPSWGFIQSAYAAEEPIYAVACTRDSPDLNQALPARQLSTGKAAEYKTREFLPGFNDAAWLGSVNGHGVGLNHVAILRDGDQPVGNPDVLVYRDMDRTGNTKANFSASSHVRVYEGEKALLYRVFIYSGQLKCLDVVVPGNGGLDSKLGTLYYERDRELLAAPYTPKRLRAQ